MVAGAPAAQPAEVPGKLLVAGAPAAQPAEAPAEAATSRVTAKRIKAKAKKQTRAKVRANAAAELAKMDGVLELPAENQGFDTAAADALVK